MSPRRYERRRPMMMITLTLALAWSVTTVPTNAAAAATSLAAVGLRTEYNENPLGIDARLPRLSWRIEGGGRGFNPPTDPRAGSVSGMGGARI